MSSRFNFSDNPVLRWLSSAPQAVWVLLLVIIAFVLYDCTTFTETNSAENSQSSPTVTECSLETLPPDVSTVVDNILTQQPTKFPEYDGSHFGNYEGTLPQEKNSYYREYTVTKPQQKSRGVRRLVVGGGSANDPDVWYYTDDHYDSFCEIPDAED